MINTLHLQSVAFGLLLALSPWRSSAQCEYTELDLETTTYQWGAEVSWELYRTQDGNNELVASFQGAVDNNTTNQLVCLEEDAISFSPWTRGVTAGMAPP